MDSPYPFTLALSEEQLAVYPPEIRAQIDTWLARVGEIVHRELHQSRYEYRLAFEQWQKLKTLGG